MRINLCKSLFLLAFLNVFFASKELCGQTVITGATFGEVTALGETPSDMVLDELRGLIYLVRPTANRVDVYDYVNKRLLNPIPVGIFPSGLAMSMDNAYLYVTNVTSATLSVILLGPNQIVNTVSLPARPEGVAVGVDGRVLITTQGIGVGNTSRTLLLYDPRQDASLQLSDVPSPPTITSANPNAGVFVGRPTTPFPGRLMRTPDGNFIIGMVAINQQLNSAQTTLFVYEVASGTVLRNRLVTGQSSVLSLAPDGGRFMSGFTNYDFNTLAVNAQMNTGNLPFNLPNSFGFSPTFNYGGSVFSPDGQTIYSAFNYAQGLNTVLPISRTLFVGDPSNLGVRLGIKLKESILGKMLITSDGATAFAISESGFMTLPVGSLFDYPILQPEASLVFLANDPCQKGVSRTTLKVSNLGKGKLTFSMPNLAAGLIGEVRSGVAPSSITFTMDPGRTVGLNRRPGTNVSGNNSGSPVIIDLASLEAINYPDRIRVYMNFRQDDQRGIIFPIPNYSSLNNNRGFRDIVLDEKRSRLYISNNALNRIEVFDTAAQKFLAPVKVGQFPESLALSLDANLLYVANTGGESIMTIDLETLSVIGSINFPPVPRNGQQTPTTVTSMATTLAGLQFVMSNGTVWRSLGVDATVRTPATASLLPANGLVGAPRVMFASPGGEYAMLLAGGIPGIGYLFDATTDNYTTARNIFVSTLGRASFTTPLGAAPRGEYFLAGGLILGSSLTPLGGVERPGATQLAPNPVPGQPPIQTTVSIGQRNVFAVWPIDSNRFFRITTPVRANQVSVTRDDERTTLELVDIRTQSESIAAIFPENPQFFVSNQNQVNVPPRQMVVDSRGNVWALTISGLTLVPTNPTSTATQPALTSGVRSVVNANDGTTNFRPGSFITINGRSLASPATSDAIPLPSVLGGSCVTMNDIPLPIISASPTQITAQIPETVRPGLAVVQVRSLMNAQQSEPLIVTVQR
jgi:YVTN family beta-propeller protein